MTTDTTPHTPSESCLCDACPWAKREQAKQAERQQAASRRQAIVHEIADFVTPRPSQPLGRRFA